MLDPETAAPLSKVKWMGLKPHKQRQQCFQIQVNLRKLSSLSVELISFSTFPTLSLPRVLTWISSATMIKVLFLNKTFCIVGIF